MLTHSYAQTNIQLLIQLQREGYPMEDLIRIREAYELAMILFAGAFRPCGKPFIDHLVGTASILASLHASVALVSAGLLHASYVHGEFEDSEEGITDAKRKRMREAVGSEVEEYIAAYTRFKWNSKVMPSIHDSIDTFGPIDRDILLLRLANQLEDYLDLGILFCPNAESRKKSLMRRRATPLINMAEKLGFPALASEMDRVCREIASTEIPEVLRSTVSSNRAYRLKSATSGGQT